MVCLPYPFAVEKNEGGRRRLKNMLDNGNAFEMGIHDGRLSTSGEGFCCGIEDYTVTLDILWEFWSSGLLGVVGG